MWLFIVPGSLPVSAVCMHLETHPGIPWGTSRPLTWSDLPLHLPVFHPSYGTCSFRFVSGGLLKELLRECGLSISTCVTPWKAPKSYKEFSSQQSSDCRSPHRKRGHLQFHSARTIYPYMPWLPFTIAAFTKDEQSAQINFKSLGQKGRQKQEPIIYLFGRCPSTAEINAVDTSQYVRERLELQSLEPDLSFCSSGNFSNFVSYHDWH